MLDLTTELLKQVLMPARATLLYRQQELFKKLSASEQGKKLPAFYLQIRDYLCAESEGRLTAESLDARVRHQFPSLLNVPSFGILFESPVRQQILLGCRLLEAIMQRAVHLLGGGDDALPSAMQWLSQLPNGELSPPPFLAMEAFPAREEEWFPLLTKVAEKICARLQRPLGEEAASRLVHLAYEELADSYAGLDSFISVLELIPGRLLDHEKLRLLSRNQIAKILMQKMEHLEQSNKALLEAQNQSVVAAQQLREANLKLAASNDELQRTLRVQEEFTSSVSHELRTPLTAIVGAAGMLLKYSKTMPAQKTDQCLQMIVSESWRLTRLVGEILDLSRIQKKGVTLNYETLNLSQLVSEIVEEMRLAHPLKRLEARASCQGEMDGDRDRLRQILVNLIGNAIKYSSEGGMVTVETKMEDAAVILSVTDVGPGIPEDQHQRIFEPFYRTKDAINYKTPGTGLGLTITKSIVDAMGGSIAVHNNIPHGCIMTVTLPRRMRLVKAA